jgi:hypothetical protein
MAKELRDIKRLLERATYMDNYGVYGSNFWVCRICDSESGAGVLARPNWHEAWCPVPRLEKKYANRGRLSAVRGLPG